MIKLDRFLGDKVWYQKASEAKEALSKNPTDAELILESWMLSVQRCTDYRASTPWLCREGLGLRRDKEGDWVVLRLSDNHLIYSGVDYPSAVGKFLFFLEGDDRARYSSLSYWLDRCGRQCTLDFVPDSRREGRWQVLYYVTLKGEWEVHTAELWFDRVEDALRFISAYPEIELGDR